MLDSLSHATGSIARPLRLAAGAALLALAVGCGDAGADDLPLTEGDAAIPESAQATTSQALGDEVTSEEYRKWLVAQQALDGIPGLELPSQVSLRRFDDADVARVEDYLESQPRARAAIEDAGLSVKDYVRTSVALERTMALAQGEPTGPTTAPALLRAPVAGEDDSAFQRVWVGRRIRVVEADPEYRPGRRWRDDGDSERTAFGKQSRKARKKWEKAQRKRGRHDRHGGH